MKHLNKTIAVILSLTFFSAASLAETEWIDRVIAVADGEIITQTELLREGSQIQRELQARNTPVPEQKAFLRQVMDRVVLKKLQLNRASRMGIRIDDGTLNRSIQRIASDNNLDLSQFRSALIAEGLDYETFRDDIRDQMTLSQVREREIDRQINVSENEVDEFIKRQLGKDERNSYLLSHILVAIPPAASPGQIEIAQAKAQGLVNTARAGEDFGTLAVKSSDGQLALKGGDLGWRDLNQVPTIFADVMENMADGDVSEIIRSASGFHILKVNEIKQTNKPNVTQTNARHILIRRDNNEDAYRELITLRNRVLAGEEFEALATEHSMDPGSAPKGGNLGWADPGTFVAEFEAAMKDLKEGEISQPFLSQFGVHIIQLLERRIAPVSDQSLKTQARNILFKQKQDEQELLWLRRLKDEAFIEYYYDEFKGSDS